MLGAFLSITPVSAAGGFVTEKVVDTIDDFSGGSFTRTALVNIPAEDISAVQLLPVGLAGEWILDPYTLASARQDCAAVSSGQYIYVLGGRSGNTFYASVERLTVGAGGAISARTSARSLPTALAGLSAFVYTSGGGTRLYVVGGATTGFMPSLAVYSASIESDGSLGTWTSEASLDYGVYYAALAQRGADVYVVGGIEILAAQRRTVEEVARARVNSTGHITEWIYDSFFSDPVYPDGVAAAEAIVHFHDDGDTLFVIGGRNSIAEAGALTTVAYADINADGSLGAWQLSGGTLLLPLYGHGAVLFGTDEILLTGGRTDESHLGLEKSVKAALVERDRVGYRLHDWCEGQDPGSCKIGSWQAGASLPVARGYHGTVQVGDWVYVIGGSSTDNVSTNTIYRGTVSGDAVVYAPDGLYESASVDMGNKDVVRLSWEATVPPGTTMTLEYARCTAADVCDWSAAPIAVTGNGSFTPASVLASVARFRYRLTLTGTPGTSTSSPRLESLHIYYDADAPDVSVSLTSSSTPIRAGGAVAPNDTLRYNIDTYNSGGVTADAVTLTVALPAQVTFLSGQCMGTQAWQSLGGNVYGCAATSVAALTHLSSTITTLVGSIPEEVTSITATAQASFPPMADLDVPPKSVGDPTPANNAATKTLSTIPLALTGTVSATPASGSSVSPGSQVEYRLEYRVTGGAGATVSNVVINASFDAAKLTNISPLDGGVIQGSSVRWYITGPLPVGATGVVRFTASVARPLDNGLSIVQSFTGWSSELPPSTLGSVSHVVASSPAMSLLLTADAATVVNPGQTVTYTLTCTNVGGMNSGDGTATATLPASLTLLSTEPAAQVNGSQVVWSLGAMTVDVPRTLKIVARVADNALHGQLVTVDGSLASTGVPSADKSLTLAVSVPASISVAKSAEAPSGYVRPGDVLTFHITLTNTGGETSGAVAVSDLVPSYCIGPLGQAGGSTLTWQVGPLAGQQSVTVSYEVTVSDPLSEQVKTIVGPAARAVVGGVTTVSGSTATVVRHWPNLWVRITDGRDLTDPGQTHTYTVTYGNYGGDSAGGTIVLQLGAGLEWLGGANWNAQANGTFTYEVGPLAAGAQGSSTFQAKVSEAISGTDSAVSLIASCSFAGSETDGDAYDNTATDVDIVAGPDLAVQSLTVAPASPNRWSSLNVSVVIANVGDEGLAGSATSPGTSEVLLEVYLRQSVSSAPAGPSDHAGGYCVDGGCALVRPAFRRAIPIASLGPGATLTQAFDNLTFTGVAGLFDVYAQIDVGGDATWGGFREGNEVNNTAALRRLLVVDAPSNLVHLLPLVQSAVAPQ